MERGPLMELATRELSEIYHVRESLERLTLVTEAMWALMREHGFTDRQLQDQIEVLDLSDGSRDGRHTHKFTCAKCGAVVVGSHCQICGATFEVDPFFWG
jgi:rubrerythrin